MALGWYVAQTKPNAEGAAARRLINQHFDAYVPRRTIRRVSRGVIDDMSEPLFRGYLFVWLDAGTDARDERWKAVNSTRAIQTLLPSGERPIAVPTAEIDGLLEAEVSGAYRTGMIEPGRDLRVIRGSLANQVMLCLESSGDRVKALWSCLNGAIEVSLRASDVAVVE